MGFELVIGHCWKEERLLWCHLVYDVICKSYNFQRNDYICKLDRFKVYVILNDYFFLTNHVYYFCFLLLFTGKPIDFFGIMILSGKLLYFTFYGKIYFLLII